MNSGLNKVFTCMENKMAACSPHDRLLYDTATSSAMFLCTKGKQGTSLKLDIKLSHSLFICLYFSLHIKFICNIGYIEHAQCLFSESSHQAMNTCTTDAITLIKTLIFSVTDLADLKVMSKELCG